MRMSYKRPGAPGWYWFKANGNHAVKIVKARFVDERLCIKLNGEYKEVLEIEDGLWSEDSIPEPIS